MTSDQKFHVPEQKAELNTSFLTEFWRDKRPLPKIVGWEVPSYYFQQGIRTLISLPMSSTITVITIAISLFMLAGFLLTLKNVDNVISGAGQSLEVTVFLKDDANKQSVEKFIMNIEDNGNIRSYEYISKEKALQRFRKQLADEAGFLDGLGKENPLPASIDLLLEQDEVGIGEVALIVAALRKNKVVEEVVYGSEWVEKVQGVLNVFRFFGLIILLTILAIIVFLISNTIKLVIYARQDEIEIMQLVGSSSEFIRIPFVIGGVIQGGVGSIIGLSFLKCAHWLINFQFEYSSVLGVSIPHLAFLTPFSVFVIIVVGIMIGALGSFFALRQFLNV